LVVSPWRHRPNYEQKQEQHHSSRRSSRNKQVAVLVTIKVIVLAIK
jgi:hypothetical protein